MKKFFGFKFIKDTFLIRGIFLYGLLTGTAYSSCYFNYPMWGVVKTQPAYVAERLNQLEGVNAIASGDSLRIILSSDRVFDFPTLDIKKSQYPILDKIAFYLKRYEYTPITIIGFADNVGEQEAKKQLSWYQANIIATYFWVHGLDRAYLRIKGEGSLYPIANPNTALGRAMNRRIEIQLKTQMCESKD